VPGHILTTASQVKCPHGGTATLSTANMMVKADGAYALLEADIHVVAGCTFTVPPAKPQPCVRIEWSLGAAMTKVNNTAVLLRTSLGKCYSAEGAMQGMAIVSQTQTKAESL